MLKDDLEIEKVAYLSRAIYSSFYKAFIPAWRMNLSLQIVCSISTKYGLQPYSFSLELSHTLQYLWEIQEGKLTKFFLEDGCLGR